MKLEALPDQLVRISFQESIAMKQAILKNETLCALIGEVGVALADALRKKGRIFFFGNGGSAADAQHLAAELTGRYLMERRPLPGISLTCNTSSLTAIANDYSFEDVFARQLEAFSHPGDVAFALTTSGASRNVVRALELARELCLIRVALTSQAGVNLRSLVDYCICLPSQQTPRVQEGHITVGHVLCEIIEHELFGQSNFSRS